MPALSEAHRILRNVVTRLKLPSIGSLEAAAGRLAPVPDLSEDGKPVREHIEELLSLLKNDGHDFSAPTQAAVDLLQALITSSYLLLKAGAHTSIEKTGSMLYNQPESYQHTVLKEYLNKLGGSAGADDKLWISARKEVLWLHDWGKPPFLEGATAQKGRGVLGQIRRDTVEREILTALLTHGRKLILFVVLHIWLNLLDQAMLLRDLFMKSLQSPLFPKKNYPRQLLRQQCTPSTTRITQTRRAVASRNALICES